MSQLVLLVGRARSGKSTSLLEMAQGLKTPTLIIEPGQASVYTESGIGFLKPNEIAGFSKKAQNGEGPKIARISSVINKKQLVAKIFGFDFDANEIFRSRALLNSNLIMEDAASYINGSMPEALKECIKAFRNYGLNLILCYHSIDEIALDIFRMQPDYVIFKKTGDELVWSKISKTKKFPNQTATKESFYKAQVFGMTPAEIVQQYDEYLDDVAKDFRKPPPRSDPKKQLEFASFLSKLAHGRKTPTTSQKKLKLYQSFDAKLRL